MTVTALLPLVIGNRERHCEGARIDVRVGSCGCWSSFRVAVTKFPSVARDPAIGVAGCRTVKPNLEWGLPRAGCNRERGSRSFGNIQFNDNALNAGFHADQDCILGAFDQLVFAVDLEEQIGTWRDGELLKMFLGGRDVEMAFRGGLHHLSERRADELVQRLIFVPGLDLKVSDTESGFAVNDTTGNLETFNVEKSCCFFLRFGFPACLFRLPSSLWLFGFLCHVINR